MAGWSLRLRDATNDISAFGRQGRWQAAVAKFQEICEEQLQPGVVTYNSLLSALDKASQTGRALNILQQLEACSGQPDIVSFCSVASACSRGTQWSNSLETLQTARQKGLLPNSFAGNAAMTALERGAQWHRALQCLEEALEYGPSPDRITYNTVITALGRQSHWEEAVAMLQELSDRLLEPNAVTFNAAATACAGVFKSLESWRTSLDLLRRGAATIASYPQVQACSSALSACSRAGRWYRALSTFQTMRLEGPAPDIAACGALLDAFDQAGQWQWSLWLLDQMSPSPVGPATPSLPSPDVLALTSVINACGAQIQWEKALHVLRAWPRRCGTTASYNAAAAACDRGLQPELVLQIVREMISEKVEVDSITYLAAVSACGKAQRWSEALLKLQEPRHRSIAVSQNVMNSAISACEKGSSWRSATALLQFQEQLLLPPNVVSLSAVVTASAAKHQWLPSMRLLEEMGCRWLRLDLVALNSFLDAAEASAQWCVATALLQELQHWRLLGSCISISAVVGSCEKDQAERPMPGLLHHLEETFTREITDQSLSMAPSGLSHFLEAEELLWSNDLISFRCHAVLRHVLAGALAQLGLLADPRRRRDARPGQLWEPRLERQFGIGATFTQRVVQPLGSGSSSWCSTARLLPRRELADGEVIQVPTAESLPGFVALSAPESLRRGAAVGYGTVEGPTAQLRPVFVQHDRSRHAERFALLSLIEAFCRAGSPS